MAEKGISAKAKFLLGVLTLLLLLASLYVNYIFLPILSNQLLVPWLVRSYAFKIWPIIYILLFVLVLFLLVNPQVSVISWIYFNIVTAHNMMWLFIYTADYDRRLYAAAPFLLSMVTFLYCFWSSLWKERVQQAFTYYVNANIVAFYLGWCAVAAVLNSAQLLHFELKLEAKLVKPCAAGALAAVVVLFSLLAFLHQKFGKGFIGFYVSVAWGAVSMGMAALHFDKPQAVAKHPHAYL